MGLDLGKLLPELSIAAPRRTPTARANWQTTYCDSEVRVGRGVESKGVFLFRKGGAFQGTLDQHESDEVAVKKLKLLTGA